MDKNSHLPILAVMATQIFSSFSLQAQVPPTIPPGVPEPGLVIWGTVANATNTSQQISITSASWSVTDGTKTAVYTPTSSPPTRIVVVGGQSYYMLEVPFDTRRFGNIVLGDPAVQGIDSFELKSTSPPTYTLMPTINGVLANVRSIDGAPAPGSTAPISGFSATTRGRVIRVDLTITLPPDSYDTWAAGFFGSSSNPDAARNADPDHDGMTNYQEFLAGTDPKSAASVLRILTFSIGQSQTTVGWQSVSNKNYLLEGASDVRGPWIGLSQIGSAGTATQTSVNHNPADPTQFYRVVVVQQ